LNQIWKACGTLQNNIELYQSKAFDIDDLISEGNIGLKSIPKFNPELNVLNFSFYASFYINI
jgi:DNA-directed RNA polymerase sigma subunit (sigma70/sigma32)